MDYSQSKIVTQASTRDCPAHVLTFGGCPLYEALCHSCSSLLFLITLFHFLPALSLCLLLVPQAAGSASLPFVTPAGTSGEDKTLWPHHWEKSKGMSGKGKSHNAIKRWEKPHRFNNEPHQASSKQRLYFWMGYQIWWKFTSDNRNNIFCLVLFIWISFAFTILLDIYILSHLHL